MLAFTFVCSKMSTRLQVKDKKYFAVQGYLSIIVIWHFLIELAGEGGGVFSSIFSSTTVMGCLGRQSPGGGGTWVFFGWVCAARDSKLAPRSRKNFP